MRAEEIWQIAEGFEEFLANRKLKGWEPQLVIPNILMLIGNHNLWFPINIIILGTTTCGSQSKGWEPHIVNPNLLIVF